MHAQIENIFHSRKTFLTLENARALRVENEVNVERSSTFFLGKFSNLHVTKNNNAT